MNKKLLIILVILFIFYVCLFGMTSYNTPSATGTTYSAVSGHHLATQAAFEVLENGGTAADAAFALAVTIGVAEPWFSNVLGGGTWALYYEAATDKVYALDGVSWSGTHATAEFFRDPDVRLSYGMHQANVPGAWDGWMKWLDRFGFKDLDELMLRAIELADDGITVNSSTIRAISRQQDDILGMPHTRAVFMPEGRVPVTDSIIYQQDYSNTLRTLVQVYNDNLELGRSAALQAANDYFYRGPIANEIVAFSKENGGHFELDDFYESEVNGIVEPISIDYNGITVYQCPPNSQGITNLLSLNILKGYDFSQYKMDSAEMIRLIVESLKLAHTDKYYYII